MRAVTRKRAALLRVYRKRRDVFLEEHPYCARCGVRSEDVHHAAGRVGLMLLDQSRWVALCRSCHRWVTEHPAAAIAEGWSQRRIGRAS